MTIRLWLSWATVVARAAGSRVHGVRGRGLREGKALTARDLDRIVVRCDRPLPLQVDGEDAGDVVEAVYEAERDVVTVLV